MMLRRRVIGTSNDPHLTPARELLEGPKGSGRGACGFVLTGQPPETQRLRQRDRIEPDQHGETL